MEYRVCFYRVGQLDSVNIEASSRINAMYSAIRVLISNTTYPSRKYAAHCILACFEVMPPKPVAYSHTSNRNYVEGSVEKYNEGAVNV